MPISLKDRLLTGLNKDWLNRQKAFGTKAAVDYLQGLAKTTAELRNIQSSDMRTIVDMEILTLEHEKELYGGEDPTVIPSLQSAIDSLTKDVRGAINTAEIPEDYRKAALTHSSNCRKRKPRRNAKHLRIRIRCRHEESFSCPLLLFRCTSTRRSKAVSLSTAASTRGLLSG